MFKIFLGIGALVSAAAAYFSGVSGMEAVLRFVIYLAVYTVGMILLLVLVLAVMSSMVDKSKPQEKDNSVYRFMTVFTLNFAFDALNVKIHLMGEEKIPSGRFLLVQNHVSMFDPLSSLCAFNKYRVGFITKPENEKLPIAGGFLHSICCLSIDRENPRNAVKTINAAVKYLEDDVCSIGLYPEGTRNSGKGLLPFHNASLKIATKAGVPIVVTSLKGTDKVKNFNPFVRKDIHINVCKVLPAEEVKGAQTAGISYEIRKALCEDLGFDFDEESAAQREETV